MAQQSEITWRDGGPGLALVLLVVMAYLPVWQAGFVWDDDVVLTANPVITGSHGLREIWTTGAADICPFTLTLFRFEHALWGFAPLPYHLVNVLLHAMSAVVLWRILARLGNPGAWLGAALWAVHPVMVESVAAICEMKNTLSGFFFLLAILFFLRWLKTKAILPYALTSLFAALAIASKTSTIILPLVLGGCAWWVEGRWRWRTLGRVAPLCLLSIAAAALSIWTQGQQLATTAVQPVRTWPERLVTAGDVTWFYLLKLLWPHPLMLMYPRWEIHAADWLSYLPLLGAILSILFFWINRQPWSRACLFASSFYLVCLLPVMGWADQVWFWNSFVADHLQYLAAMGPLALAGAGIARLNDTPLRLSICTALLLILGSISWQRAGVFADRDTLWTDTVARNPKYWPAYNHLGYDLLQKGNVTAAIRLFEKSLAINPDYAKAQNNLGTALARTGQMNPAIERFRAALQIEPDFAEAHSNLGLALFQQGQTDDAIAQYQQALQLEPENAQVHIDLAMAHLKKGQADEATAQFQAALKLDPTLGIARSSLTALQAIRQNQGQK